MTELVLSLRSRDAIRDFELERMIHDRPSYLLDTAFVRTGGQIKIHVYPPDDSITLTEWLANGNTPSLCVIAEFLRQLSTQIAELEDLLMKVQTTLLRSNLLFVSCPRQPGKPDRMPLFYWLLLPCDIEQLDQADAIMQQASIWQSLSSIGYDNEAQTLINEHQVLLAQERYQESLMISEKLRLLDSRQSDRTDKSQPVPAAKSISERIKAKANSRWRKLYSRISSRFSSQTHAIEFEQTVPLNLQDESFRLALICEEPPGTPQAEEGLKAFILVDEFLIGRDRHLCDFPLQDLAVGRFHARISRHGHHYFIEDLGSRNGTYLDGKRLSKHQTYLLPDRARLKFANQSFYFQIEY